MYCVNLSKKSIQYNDTRPWICSQISVSQGQGCREEQLLFKQTGLSTQGYRCSPMVREKCIKLGISIVAGVARSKLMTTLYLSLSPTPSLSLSRSHSLFLAVYFLQFNFLHLSLHSPLSHFICFLSFQFISFQLILSLLPFFLIHSSRAFFLSFFLSFFFFVRATCLVYIIYIYIYIIMHPRSCWKKTAEQKKGIDIKVWTY